MTLRAPFRSEFDPSEEGEGSIDPLGLQPGYERLADRLLPAVTVRMGRPRFVTALALGACVCSCERWDGDTVAADEVTPPWLVHEWFVVEAFVRASEALHESSGIPGIQKVGNAVRNQRPVSASSYLKTATVFGFTGIFRRLARGIGIVTEDGRLDNGGYELLSAWGKDQGLDGIIDASSGPGHDFRERLRRVVTQGLEKGCTTHQPGEFWRELALRLDPSLPGPREAKVLLDRILSRAGNAEMVGQISNALVLRGKVGRRDDEAPFLRKLVANASGDLKTLLTAIDTYEAFARTITNALDTLRYCASQNGGAPVSAEDLRSAGTGKSALDNLAPSIARVRAHSMLLEWLQALGLANVLERFDAVRSHADLFDAVLDYHAQIQKNKPPYGKRPWFEQVRTGKVIVRAGYVLKDPPPDGDAYVHEYRIPTFSRFLEDLGAYR